jgi:hypothetical protein
MFTFTRYPMNPLRTSGLVLSALIAAQLHAQFTLVNSSPESIFVLGSLSSGTRYIGFFGPVDGQPGTRTIYNMDLSVHRVLNYPAPPPDMRWASMGYITEALFDTDPSTIEFTLVAMPMDGPGDFAVFIVREDASILFSQNPGNLTNGPLFNASYGPIFTTDEGTFMTVHTSSVQGPPVNIYQLPGTLPCMDCFGSPMPDEIGMGGTINTDGLSGMTLVPNPAQDEVWVRFNGDIRADALSITDASGREVFRTAITDGHPGKLSIAHLANGRYHVSAIKRDRHIGSLPLLIAR